MSIDLTIKSNRDILGTDLLTIGSYPRNKKYETIIIYKSGIPAFDKVLADCKFEETDCILQVGATQNSMVFLLCYNNLNPFSFFGIWRKRLTSYELAENQNIKIPKFNHFKDSMPFIPLGGGLGAGLSQIIKMKEAERRNYKVIGSKDSEGSIIKLNYYEDEDNTEKTIILNLPQEYLSLTKSFFNEYWKTTIESTPKTKTKSSSCFIATVCYQDPYAAEVLLLKKFRDTVLMKYMTGRLFIKIYYIISPYLAKHLKNNTFLQNQIKSKILDKIVKRIKSSNGFV